MCWYKKYLTIFEKSPLSVPDEIYEQIRLNTAKMQSENPVATIIVIAYNEERRLTACLWSLSNMICSYPLEIIGVDNDSSDSTSSVFEKSGVRWLKEEQRSCGYARNRGLMEAKGKYILCVDADTLYPLTYAEKMIKEMEKPGTSAVFGSWGFVPDKQYPRYKMVIYEFLRDINLRLLSAKSPERAVRGLAFAHIAGPAKEIGYRVKIRRGEDGAMAYELKKFGKVRFIGSRKVKVMTSTATLKSDGSVARALYIRMVRAIKGIRKFFIKTKGELKDQPDNLIE